MRLIKRITGIEGIYPNGRPRVKLPTGCRVFNMTFFLTKNGAPLAIDSTSVGRVRLYVNGLPYWDVPASWLCSRVLREGRTLAVGELPIDFADPSRADKIDEQVTAWNLFGEGSFEAEIELLDQPEGTVIGIVGLMEIDGYQSLVNGKPVKQMVKIFTLSKNANGGLNDLDNIPIRDAIQRLTFFGAVLPTEYKVDVDGVTVLEATNTQLERVYAKHGHVPQANSSALRFDYTERLDDFLVATKTLQVRFTMPEDGRVDVMVEALSPGFI